MTRRKTNPFGGAKTTADALLSVCRPVLPTPPRPMAFFVLTLLIWLGSALYGESSKQILILHSYHQGWAWTDGLTHGIQEALHPHRSIGITIEYMDTKRTSDPALDILNGTEASDIPVITHSINPLLFDYRQLLQAGLRPGDLPANVTIVNRPDTLWRQHKGILLSVLAVFVLLVLLVVSLAIQVVLRRRTERKLAGQNELLEEAVRLRTQQLRSSEEEYRRLYETSLICHFRTSLADGHFLKANAATAEFFGFSSVEELVRNVNPRDLYPKEYQKKLIDQLHRTGAVSNFEIPFLVNGNTYHLSLTVVLHPDKGYIEGSAIDITPRKQAETELIQHRDQLDKIVKERTAELRARNIELQSQQEQLQAQQATLTDTIQELEKAVQKAQTANEAKTLFLANMSHELRTPMNAIIGFSDLLSAENSTPKQAEYIERICAAGDHLLDVINDILDCAKIEAGKMEIHCVPVAAGQIVEEIKAILCPMAQARNIEFQTFCAIDLPDSLYTDPARLRQCLINLVNNAIKFTRQGHVYLHVNQETIESVPWIRFDVEDTGIGIPPAQLEAIFEAFNQADNSLTREFGGTGLGLTITKQLAGLLGGSLSVSSALGKGSVFTLRLPARLKIADGSPQDACPKNIL
ncbi:MAG: PAS domain S-box protein [Sedimentisphaerales bacterium]|nr:PAS domain S-box protein [Sedimentisphaerales bacterium]